MIDVQTTIYRLESQANGTLPEPVTETAKGAVDSAVCRVVFPYCSMKMDINP